MGERGVVREWHADEGWGVVDALGAPGGCWVHYSVVLMDGYRALEPGRVVDVVVEAVEQDGFAVRAVEVRPVGEPPPAPGPPRHGSPAYRSALTIRYDGSSEFTTPG